MSRQQVLKFVISGMLTLLFLVACGSTDSTSITENPPATFTPRPKRVFHSDPLSTGDVAPDFTLPDSEGNMVNLVDQLKDNQYIVLVFYSDYN